jgi:hypothetical protein
MFNDIDGWLMGPQFLGALAAFISAILSVIAGGAIGRIFGITA